MSGARIIYSPRPDVTPQAELDALASVYEFVLSCGEARRAEEKKTTQQAGATKENAGGTNAGDDAKKGSLKHEVRANTSLPR